MFHKLPLSADPSTGSTLEQPLEALDDHGEEGFFPDLLEMLAGPISGTRSRQIGSSRTEHRTRQLSWLSTQNFPC